VIKAMEGMMTWTAEAMTEIGMTTVETVTVIIRAMTNVESDIECQEGRWTRRYLSH